MGPARVGQHVLLASPADRAPQKKPSEFANSARSLFTSHAPLPFPLMAKHFDTDAVGAILEFFDLFSTNQHVSRQEWEKCNLKNRAPPTYGFVTRSLVWIGPAVSKAHLLDLLETGRNRTKVRRQLDRAFLTLENRLLIEPYSSDDNLRTQYRVITELGRELLKDDAYAEYIFGLEEVVRRWKNSILKIYSPSGCGIGTGFLVASDIVATARHVVDELGELELAFDDGTTVHPAKVVQPAKDIDVALVHLASPVANRRPFRLAPDRDLLDEVVIFGYPPVPHSNDAYLVVNRGEVSSLIEDYGNQHLIIVSCLTRGGNSGGPVVNRRGQVIGLVSRSLYKKLADGEESLNEGIGHAAAVPSEWISDLMDGTI